MSPFNQCQLVVMFLMLWYHHQVCGDEAYSTHNSLDRKVHNQPSSLALTTASEQGDGYGNTNDDTNDPHATSAQKKLTMCAHYGVNPSDSIDLSKRDPKMDAKKGGSMDGLAGRKASGPNTTLCSSYCFTLWVVPDPRNKSDVIISKKGCWLDSQGIDCQANICLSNSPPRNNDTHFCCCSGDLCNDNYHDMYNSSEHSTTPTLATPVAYGPLFCTSYRMYTIIIALVSVVSVSLVTVFLYLAYRLCLTSKPISPQSSFVARVETPEPLLPEFNIDDLKIEDVLVRGRYSEIRKGWLRDKEVAVKIYQPHHRQYYYNERNAFTQPFMDHENIVKFYGAREQEDPESNVMQYVIVTKYIPLGSLTSYLKHNTVDWYTLCHMCQAISRGLAYLHTDIQSGDLFKPAIAHRDLNTRNILVNPDLTCMIADLGFSVGMIGSKIIKNGVPENAEQATLADVGTLRYMAPEVFDGAVNLRDCEASLKQIDVYALGLVIWEIASRCIDLYQGAPVPEYQLPFQAESRTHPTFEEMQVLVVKHKTRPRFPEVWKDANPAVRSLKETIEDCWDTDAEARLTSLCVQERIADIAALWIHGNKHRGVTPTLNATMNLPECSQSSLIYSGSAVVSNGVTYLPSYIDSKHETSKEAGVCRQREDASLSVIATSLRCREDTRINESDGGATAPLISNVGHLTSSGSFEAEQGRVRSWLQEQSMSGSTMDTLLPPTPSIEDANSTFDVPAPVSQASDIPPLKASNVMIAANKAVILHPNQGRNPTAERNTHKRSDEELTVSGNVLIGPGNIPDIEAGRNNRRGSLGTRSAPPNRTGDGNFDGTDAIESSSLMQNDSLGQHYIRPRNTPIPYFQNHVHGENTGTGEAISSYLTRPKLANVSGNRSSYLRLEGEESCPEPAHLGPSQTSDKLDSSSLKGKLSKFIRPKNFGIKFSHMVFGGKHKNGQKSVSNTQNVESQIVRKENINRTAGQYINIGLDASPVSRSVSNINTANAVAMKVQIVNGAAVTSTTGDTDTNQTLTHQNGPQARLSATNVMRLGVFTATNHEELPSPSLFPKGSGDSVVNDPCYLQQDHVVPLQQLVATRSATDYGSMRPTILNQAYGLDSDIEISATYLSELPSTTSVNGIQNTSISSDYHQPATDLSHNFNLGSAILTDKHPDLTTGDQVSFISCSSDGGNLSPSSASSCSAADSALVPVSDYGPLNTVISSPINQALSSLSEPVFSQSRCRPVILVKNNPQSITQGLYSGQNSAAYNGLQNHHTDTKGGNSIMHCFYLEASINQPRDVSQHFQQSPQKTGQLDMSTMTYMNNATQAETANDVTSYTCDIVNSVNRNLQSNQELSHDQTGHQNHQINGHVDIVNIDNNNKVQNWQEINLSKSFTLADKSRPQSLSLKGHNYNQCRERSLSSSSLSSVSSLTPTTEKFSQNSIGVKVSNENTIVLPNVTLDNISAFTQNRGEIKPATIPTGPIAVPTNTGSMRSVGSSGNITHNGAASASQSAIDSDCFVNITDCQSHTFVKTRSHDNEGSQLYATGKDVSDSSEKIRKRIKTPVSFKKGRLSLYDDRLMTQSLGFVSLTDVEGVSSFGGCNNSSDLYAHSGHVGHGGRLQNGHEGNIVQMRRADYHKMIKSDSDLVV